MKILKTDIFRFSIPMVPFTIATGTMDQAQNLFIRIHTDGGFYGVGECSAFPVITGETQSTCYEMARDFARIWKGENPLQITDRMNQLESLTAFNATIKSAFDMALFDIAAKEAGMPLYQYLKGAKKPIETDLTIGIGSPEQMALTAREFISKGVRMIKIKLGKDPLGDVERVRRIREAVGPEIILRIDANQGWDFPGACQALTAMGNFRIQFCEQPLRYWDDHLLPQLRRISPIPLMADESVFDFHDAERLIEAGACDYVNIKFAKSGGILGAQKINEVCAAGAIPCMMGGMLESRIALSAFAHFAMATENIIFYDMDTCLLGHLADPVRNGLRYNGYFIELPDLPGIGADADEEFLQGLESCTL